jgi:hypothetical protein
MNAPIEVAIALVAPLATAILELIRRRLGSIDEGISGVREDVTDLRDDVDRHERWFVGDDEAGQPGLLDVFRATAATDGGRDVDDE